MILEIREYTGAAAVVFGPDEDHLVSLGSWALSGDETEDFVARKLAEAGLRTASEMLNIHKRMFAYRRSGDAEDPA